MQIPNCFVVQQQATQYRYCKQKILTGEEQQELKSTKAEQQRILRNNKQAMLTSQQNSDMPIATKETKSKPLSPEDVTKALKIKKAAAERQRLCRKRKQAMLTSQQNSDMPIATKETKSKPLSPDDVTKALKIKKAAAERQRLCRKRKQAMLTSQQNSDMPVATKETKSKPLSPGDVTKALKIKKAAAERQRLCRKRKQAMLTSQQNSDMPVATKETKSKLQLPEDVNKTLQSKTAAAERQRLCRKRKQAKLTPLQESDISVATKEAQSKLQLPEDVNKTLQSKTAAAERQRLCRKRKQAMCTSQSKSDISMSDKLPEEETNALRVKTGATARKRKQRELKRCCHDAHFSLRLPCQIEKNFENTTTVFNDSLPVEELSTYRRDPLVAQNLYWETSGLSRFEYGDTQVRNRGALLEEIKACKVDDNIVCQSIEAYKKVMDFEEMTIGHCACCGIMIMSTTSDVRLNIESLICLRLSEEEYDNWFNMETELRILYSVFVQSSESKMAYHVIPDLVTYNRISGKHEVRLCNTCKHTIRTKGNAPKISVANGYDFGCIWKSALTELTNVEMCLVAKVRIYSDIIKLRAPENLGSNTRMSALKGHVIAMRHTGAQQAAEVLPRLTIDDYVVVYFIGEKDRWNNIRRNWKLHSVLKDRLQVRLDVVAKWLNVFRAVNPLYRDIPYLELNDPEHRQLLLSIPEKILDNAHVTNDPLTERLERQSCSSTAPTVPDHNHLCQPDSADHSDIVDENERAVDSVLLNDFSGDMPHAGTTPEGKTLEAIQMTLNYAAYDSSEKDFPENDNGLCHGQQSDPIIPIAVERQGELLNEYTHNDELLYGAFPWLFLFGKGLCGNGPVPRSHTKYLLQHFNKRFSQDHNFIFLLFNQLQRHAASSICSARVYAANGGIRRFIDTLNSNNFDQKLADAVRDPTSNSSRIFLRKLLPNVKTCGSKVPFGPVERQESKYKSYAMKQHFGNPPFFLTLTPNEINSPLCIRLCKRDGDALSTLNDITLIQAETRAYMTSRNPVAAALFFDRIIQMTIKYLLGIDMSSNQKSTVPFQNRRKGVLSTIVAHFGVVECQGRGTLHTHMFIWGGLPPFLLQKCAEYHDLVEQLQEVLDSMLTAEISKEGYDGRSERSQAEAAHGARFYPSLYECPSPFDNPMWPEAFQERYESVASAVQVHSHTFTCHKGKAGKIGCRMGYPQTIRNEANWTNSAGSKLHH